MTDTQQFPTTARAAMAAGALFVDDDRRIMLVKPTYKPGWEIPGGYVEPGESPRQACIREINEELSIRPTIGALLVIDWAPHPEQGDKLLFIFDGGHLDEGQLAAIRLQESELSEHRYVAANSITELAIPRLTRRLTQALLAQASDETRYLEQGSAHPA